MTVISRASEELARTINRRTAVKRAAAAVFGAVAAFSVEGFRRRSSLAVACSYVTLGDCTCNPPNGTYCNSISESYCSGSVCSGGCEVDESWRYVGGCWCSATCSYTDQVEGRIRGYYKCCDCACDGYQCACREFVPVAPGEEGSNAGATGVVPPLGGAEPANLPDGFPDLGGDGPTEIPSFPVPGGDTSGSTPGDIAFPDGFPFNVEE